MIEGLDEGHLLSGRAEKMVILLEERDLGVLLCVVSLFITLLAQSPESYTACLPKCVKILDRLVRIIDVPQDYTYYAIPSPWLQVSPVGATRRVSGTGDEVVLAGRLLFGRLTGCDLSFQSAQGKLRLCRGATKAGLPLIQAGLLPFSPPRLLPLTQAGLLSLY